MSKSQETKKQISGTDIVGLISAVLAIISSLVERNKNTEANLDEKKGVSITLNDAGQVIKINGLDLKDGHFEYSKKENNINFKIEQKVSPSKDKGDKWWIYLMFFK